MVFLAPFIVLVFGISLRMLLGMIYGARGPEPDDIIYVLVRIVSWIFIFLGVFSWCMMPLAGSPGALIVCPLLWIIGGFALVDMVVTSRETNRRTNAKLLAIAQREGQLSEISELFDGLRQGRFVGAPARELGYELQAGTPLYESVRNHPKALPRTAAAYTAVGTLASAEPQALDELSRPTDPTLAAASRSWFDYIAYLIAMMLTMGFLLSLFGIFIIPQFREIFWEFGLELPPATELLVDGFALTPMSIFTAFAASIAILVLQLLCILYLCDLRVLRGTVDWLFRRAHIATVQRMIALGVEHRVELPRLLYALSVTYPVRSIRHRLSAAYADTNAGQPLPAVLADNRLLDSNEQGLVETAERVGNLPWALRQIAVRREGLLARHMGVMVRIAYPIIVLLLALCVAFVVVALFDPLVKLVEALS